jgi:dTDP-4-amino-4,6-dideoxy-D-galactose acyltransferase
MIESKKENAVTFYDLKWDTEYFGVMSAKAILHKSLTLNEWADLKLRFKEYQFISIENRNSEPVNAQMIGSDTIAFLADVNIQFAKKVKEYLYVKENITIQNSLNRNEQVIKIADFKFSKFIEDQRLANRGGDRVYHQWLLNSFGDPDKFYALSKDDNDDINGFLLYSYSGDNCVIELIAVSQISTKGGIGTSLFKVVENEAYRRGCKEIRVGTQIRNMGAINFYQKVGCRQVGCHQVYHLWNID